MCFTGLQFLLLCSAGNIWFHWKIMLCVIKNNYLIGMRFAFCSGQDHTVTHRRVVATPQLGSLLQILAFMVCGLITMMAHTHLTVILTTLSIHLGYFILHQLNFSICSCIASKIVLLLTLPFSYLNLFIYKSNDWWCILSIIC